MQTNHVERIRKYAEDGVIMAEMARRLGISREWVRHLARREGIAIKQKYSSAPKRDRKGELDQIRAYASEGLTAREIHAKMGLTPGSISFAARRMGVSLRVEPPRPPAPAWVPKPRVITGGIPTKVSSNVAGSISELLVAADLMARGYAVFMPVIASRPHDIIALKGKDILTIEVRSAHRNKRGYLSFDRKPSDKSDHYALVITGEPVAYKPEMP